MFFSVLIFNVVQVELIYFASYAYYVFSCLFVLLKLSSVLLLSLFVLLMVEISALYIKFFMNEMVVYFFL